MTYYTYIYIYYNKRNVLNVSYCITLCDVKYKLCIIKVYDLNIGAVRNVFSRHHYARSDVEAAIFCSKAGCDWNCGMVILNCQGIKLMIHTLHIY